MLRRYTNTVPPSILQQEVDDTETTLDVLDTSNYPTKFPFIVAIERGTIYEEACLVTAKDATTLTVTRGYDGTQAVSHPGMDSSGDSAALVEHTTAAIDYREAQTPSVTEAERDALDDTDVTDMWDGRTVFNSDRRSIEVAHYDGASFLGWFGILPTGVVLPFSSEVVPTGFLLCDGSIHSRADYPGLAALYATDGFPFGNGDGSTTFEVPDLRQRFPLGVAASGTGDALGDTGGAIDHVHGQPTHTHGQTTHTHTNPNVNSGGAHVHSQGNTGSNGSHTHTNPNTGSAGSHIHAFSGATTSSGGSHSHSFSDSFTTGGPSSIPFTQSGSGQQLASYNHSHSGSVSGTTGSHGGHTHVFGVSNMTDPGHHIHAQSSTGSGGSHVHSTPNTNSNGSHAHSQGSTGASGGDTTGASGDDTTASANPPFLTLNYIVKV